MFLYKINSIDKLISIAKNRDYIENNPELCKLINNPYIKDDTELAIGYNEYKGGKPEAGKKFVDYYYTHAPELDAGSLIEWRKKIINDPELLEYARENDTKLNEIWALKKKEQSEATGYNWLGNIIDCLQYPCSYTSYISPVIGSITDSRAKYNLKNTSGKQAQSTFLGLPSYITNKLPAALTKGCLQLVDMISNQTAAVSDIAIKNKTTVKEDPFVLSDAELIGGDVLSDIASRMGDCFRIYEYQYRYNPYDYSQNSTGAERYGVIAYDKNGNPYVVTPNGNNISGSNYSSNKRLSPTPVTKDILLENMGSINTDNTMAIKLTFYNGILLSDNRYYIDATGAPGSKYPDPWGCRGYNANSAATGIFIPPNSVAGLKERANGTANMRVGCATRIKDVHNYYKKLLASKFPNITIPSNFESLISKAIKNVDLNVTLLFPNGQRTLPIFDTGGGPGDTPWIDITGQFFFTKEGWGLAKIFTSKGMISADSPTNYPLTPDMLKNAIPQSDYLKSFQVIGAQNNMVQGLYFFSSDFCITYGLDPNIFAQIGPQP